jgi:(1->4)-alpha-D-glucan 1-alpha-D-glucosylmutase
MLDALHSGEPFVSDALPRLAELHGIGLEYHDAWGNPRSTPEATLRALLAATGIDADTDADIERALAAHAEARWRQMLAPVVVVRHGERAALRVNLAAALDLATLSWRLSEETGAVHTGALAPAVLPDTVSADFDGTALVARDFVLPLLPPPGYHRLAIHAGDAVLGETLLVVAPATCYRPPALDDGGKAWGSTVQLYALRSARNWGIGDFTDLSALANQWAARGAGVVGVNPLHSLFPQCPAQASPYSPSSRLFLNILYLDVEAIAA